MPTRPPHAFMPRALESSVSVAFFTNFGASETHETAFVCRLAGMLGDLVQPRPKARGVIGGLEVSAEL